MINTSILRKYLALTINAMLPLIAFYITSSYYGLYWGLGFMLIILLLTYVIANKLLAHPFRDMVEGKGFITFDLTSTGIITPFITTLNPRQKKFIQGNIKGNKIEDIFDRNTILQISEPIKQDKVTIKDEDGKDLITDATTEKDGILTITLDKKKYNSGRFAMQHFPVLIYNSQIQSLLTKDFLSNKEKDTFAEHTILYVKEKTKQLIDASTHFGRAVVDLLKPKNEFLKSGWVWLLILGAIIIIFFMLAPKIISMVQNSAGGSIMQQFSQPVGRA